MSKIVTPRCIRCRKPLREDGTCQNPNCVRYVPEENEGDGETKDDKTDAENKE